jgi:hypothetical protein
MPSLAEADTVMASEASSAAAIRTKRLIWFSLPSRNRDQAQVPDERVCSRGPKLNPQCDIRASGATYSRQCAAAAEFYVVRDATTKKCTVVDTKPTTTTTTIVDNGTFKTKTKAESA